MKISIKLLELKFNLKNFIDLNVFVFIYIYLINLKIYKIYLKSAYIDIFEIVSTNQNLWFLRDEHKGPWRGPGNSGRKSLKNLVKLEGTERRKRSR